MTGFSLFIIFLFFVIVGLLIAASVSLFNYDVKTRKPIRELTIEDRVNMADRIVMNRTQLRRIKKLIEKNPSLKARIEKATK